MRVLSLFPEDALMQGEMRSPESIALDFYSELRREVMAGNSCLGSDEQAMLQGHYNVMMNPEKYPVGLSSEIYSARRSHAVREIMALQDPVVLDAGCGYGSESFLFASLGARVLAVDRSTAQIGIAVKRKKYYEEKFGTPLDITFEAADLNTYTPSSGNISLTWIASVLAAIEDQDDFMRRVYSSTCPGGRVMITDMNLMNPLFLLNEWRRRRRAVKANAGFARNADFRRMLARRDRKGAAYYPSAAGEPFDDVQFFTARTLSALLKRIGFYPQGTAFSGFMPPRPRWQLSASMERLFSNMPFLRRFGYFYLVAASK